MIVPAVQRPDDLAPAVAGALVRGDVPSRLALATLAAWSESGRIDLRAAGKTGFAIRLAAVDPPSSEFESALWSRLRSAADAGGGLTQVEVRQVLRGWPVLAASLEKELIGRGWLRGAADGTRSRLRRAAGATFVLAILVLLLRIGGGPAGLVAVSGLLALIAIGLLLARSRVGRLTAVGLVEARKWRQYRDNLRRQATQAASPESLAATIPDLIAFGDETLIDRPRRESQPGLDQALLIERERLRATDHLVLTSVLLLAAFPADSAVFDGGPAGGFAGADGGFFGGGDASGGGGGDGGSF